jgi:hypothetical protein
MTTKLKVLIVEDLWVTPKNAESALRLRLLPRELRQRRARARLCPALSCGSNEKNVSLRTRRTQRLKPVVPARQR